MATKERKKCATDVKAVGFVQELQKKEACWLNCVP
jgi:hypothetical protein